MSSEGQEKLEVESGRMPTSSSKVNLAIMCLRLLAFFATLSATLIMALNKQTISIAVATIGTSQIKATLTAKFQHTPAFVFFVIANANVSLHNLLMLVVTFMRPKYNFKGLAPLAIPLLDLGNVAIVSGAAGAAAFMGQLGRDGNTHAKWNKICDRFDSFCDRGAGAIIASFIGLMLLIIICSMSIAKLRNHT